jgi:glycosyltransferase involved in cell wall biosynthesis
MPVTRRPEATKAGRTIAARTLSVVVPVKDERENVGPLCQSVRAALDGRFAWELVFVDDGSTDGTFEELGRHAAADARVKVVRLRRNFGQAAALQAGIDAAGGSLVATMDGDLQNDPADLPEMIAKLDDGFDLVLGERANRQDSAARTLPSKLANTLIRKVTGLSFRDFGCTIRVLRSDLARNLRLYGEMHRFVPVLAHNLGARITQVPVRHHARRAGTSKYGIGRTGRVLLDLLTVRFLSGYLTRPMHFLGGLGLIFFLLSIASLVATVALKLASGIEMTGNPLLLLSVLFGLVGVQMVSMGLLGEVLMRTYYESQDRRPYVVRDSRNLFADDEGDELAA